MAMLPGVSANGSAVALPAAIKSAANNKAFTCFTVVSFRNVTQRLPQDSCRHNTTAKEGIAPMIDLYAAGTSNGMSARIALEECALKYNFHPIALHKCANIPENCLSLNPNGQIPVSVDDE